MPYNKALEVLYRTWDNCTRTQNAITLRLLCLETESLDLNKDGAVLRAENVVFGKPIQSLAYELAVKNPAIWQFTRSLPSGAVASMTRNTASYYSAHRRNFLLYNNENPPLHRFPAPLSIRAVDVSITKDPANENGFLVILPVMRGVRTGDLPSRGRVATSFEPGEEFCLQNHPRRIRS